MMPLGLFHSSQPSVDHSVQLQGYDWEFSLGERCFHSLVVAVGFAAMESLFPRVTNWSAGAKHFPVCWGTTLEMVFSSIRVFFNSVLMVVCL